MITKQAILQEKKQLYKCASYIYKCKIASYRRKHKYLEKRAIHPAIITGIIGAIIEGGYGLYTGFKSGWNAADKHEDLMYDGKKTWGNLLPRLFNRAVIVGGRTQEHFGTGALDGFVEGASFGTMNPWVIGGATAYGVAGGSKGLAYKLDNYFDDQINAAIDRRNSARTQKNIVNQNKANAPLVSNGYKFKYTDKYNRAPSTMSTGTKPVNTTLPANNSSNSIPGANTNTGKSTFYNVGQNNTNNNVPGASSYDPGLSNGSVPGASTTTTSSTTNVATAGGL